MIALALKPDESISDPVRRAPPAVGRGVPRLPRPQLTRPKQGVVPPAPEDVWVKEPVMADQLKTPGAWKLAEVETLILDMSDDKDRKRYSETIAIARSDRANVVIVDHDRQFHAPTGSWRIFLVLQHVLFRRTLDLKKAP